MNTCPYCKRSIPRDYCVYCAREVKSEDIENESSDDFSNYSYSSIYTTSTEANDDMYASSIVNYTGLFLSDYSSTLMSSPYSYSDESSKDNDLEQDENYIDNYIKSKQQSKSNSTFTANEFKSYQNDDTAYSSAYSSKKNSPKKKTSKSQKTDTFFGNYKKEATKPLNQDPTYNYPNPPHRPKQWNTQEPQKKEEQKKMSPAQLITTGIFVLIFFLRLFFDN